MPKKLTEKAKALLAKKQTRTTTPQQAAQPAKPANTMNVRGGSTYAGTIIKGVYLNHNRNAAVVVGLGKQVHYLNMVRGVVDLDSVSHDRFMRDFDVVLPNYPVRRAARIMHESPLNKTPKAARALRIVLSGSITA